MTAGISCRRRAWLGLLLLASACTVGPDFVQPKPPDVATYRGAPADPRVTMITNPDPRWWTGFGDPILTGLIETAIHQNLNQQQAVLRVIEEQQNIVAARAAGLPTLSGKSSYMREQIGAKGILESNGVYGSLDKLADPNNPINQLAPGAGQQLSTALGGALGAATQPINLFSNSLSSSWELDLFGKVRRSVEQATAQTEAQAEAANDSLIMLEEQVAQAYVQLRGAQALYASQQENIRAAQGALDVNERKYRQGLGTDLTVEQSRTQLLSYQQQLPTYEKQALQAIDSINILLAAPPGTLDARLLPPVPLPAPPAVVGIGVPSTLARRRPDVRQAEAMLHAQTANVGVAVASFYPDVSLTGSLGIRATDAAYITRWAGHFYSAGPSVSLPIFEGGKLAASLKMARAQQIEAALKYRGTVLQALKEVEDALVAYRTDRAARDRLIDTVRSAEITLQLANSQFKNGLADFLNVLNAQESLVQARQQRVQADMTLVNDIVTLYVALGGGWEDPGAAPDTPPVPVKPPPLPAALDAVADTE